VIGGPAVLSNRAASATIDKQPDAQLPHLETSWKAAELGSFTGATRVLGLT
jgi:hypothetical protein